MGIGGIITGVVTSLIAAFFYDAYRKRRDKGDFKAESIALEFLNLAVSILPEEDQAKLYDQWLADLVDLDTSFKRIHFASGLPLAAFTLRSKALIAVPIAAATRLYTHYKVEFSFELCFWMVAILILLLLDIATFEHWM